MTDRELRELLPRRAWADSNGATGREAHAAAYTYPNGFAVPHDATAAVEGEGEGGG
eukprot:CAMPEP_0203830880 /NCGR_PEP_ID=MMETSP0115-20131106/66993_1 /ASSEMBLY_ACC=CAM_ASM_000227 /TAXON_ID=33651 /ORGANISM="Bicosoecid sp, Strain ms1" /LENGTH=55 /DNA_ID=CAMNT_0050739943 /DNA_START=33 /DNA_END=197 /DNA_ORIENTATION=+